MELPTSDVAFNQPALLKQHPVTRDLSLSKRTFSVAHHPSAPEALSRRSSTILFLLSPLLAPGRATAFSFGISEPKAWLREQKKKTSKYLLAPIIASRESLLAAYAFLSNPSSGLTEREVDEMEIMLRSASRDCVPEDRNSIVSFQAASGVEVCTFRLVLKNASSLLAKNDPARIEAETMLDDLIRSFSSLNGMAFGADFEQTSTREKIEVAVMDTISSLDRFEQSVKNCLEL